MNYVSSPDTQETFLTPPFSFLSLEWEPNAAHSTSLNFWHVLFSSFHSP